ncbi:MAG TPA: hypothetical protein O0W90_04740 [Methanocorpusculum sp.]|nr:hypothetical protein [Methanocorpusculum sp.]
MRLLVITNLDLAKVTIPKTNTITADKPKTMHKTIGFAAEVESHAEIGTSSLIPFGKTAVIRGINHTAAAAIIKIIVTKITGTINDFFILYSCRIPSLKLYRLISKHRYKNRTPI